MKTKMIAAVMALGIGVFACAAPTEQELPTEASGTAADAPKENAEENTGTSESELRIKAGGTGCGTECQSVGGDQKCCCAVGDRCVSGATFCKCEPATVIGGGGVFYAP